MYNTLCMEPFLKVITYQLKFYVRVVIFGTFPTDLSKTFDGISHVILVAKLNADGFTLPPLKLIYNYLGNQKQNTKTNLSYSSWHHWLFSTNQMMEHS